MVLRVMDCLKSAVNRHAKVEIHRVVSLLRGWVNTHVASIDKPVDCGVKNPTSLLIINIYFESFIPDAGLTSVRRC